MLKLVLNVEYFLLFSTAAEFYIFKKLNFLFWVKAPLLEWLVLHLDLIFMSAEKTPKQTLKIQHQIRDSMPCRNDKINTEDNPAILKC